MKGREYLLKGVYWSVGNGSTLNLTTDAWIPRPTSFRPVYCPPSLDSTARVIDLIDRDASMWRTDLVSTLFLPCDVEHILKIHLVHHTTPDELTWYYDKSGIFTVKSCYWLIHDLRKNAASTSTGLSKGAGDTVLWKQIWKLKVPPRVKTFVWRCANNILPCKTNLKVRKCVPDPYCSVCYQEETLEHVFFHCVRAQLIWSHYPGTKQDTSKKLCFRKFLESMSSKHIIEDVEQWVMILYGIWFDRNLRIFQGIHKEEHVILEEQLHTLDEFRKAARRRHVAGMVTVADGPRWKAPMGHFIKINCDGSSSDTGCGIGMIARDHLGVACFIGARSIQEGSSAEIAEAEAMLWAVQTAVELELTHVEMESDSLVIIHKLQRRQLDRGVIGALVSRILSLSESIEEIRWSFTRRTGNEAAHHLAQLRPSVSFFDLCLNSLPVKLDSIVCKDME